MKSKVFGMSTLYAKEENHRKQREGLIPGQPLDAQIDNPSLLANRQFGGGGQRDQMSGSDATSMPRKKIIEIHSGASDATSFGLKSKRVQSFRKSIKTLVISKHVGTGTDATNQF